MDLHSVVSFISVTIIFAYACGFWTLSTSAIGFQTYRNPSLGFSMDYPSDWKTWDDRFSNENVTFMIPPTKDNLTSLYDAHHIGNVTPYLDTDTMTLKNKPADQVAHQMIQNLSENNPAGLEFRLIRSNQSTVAGIPGWKIEAFLGPEANPLF